MLVKGATDVRAWVSNIILIKVWDVIPHPNPNFDDVLVKLPLTFGHELVIGDYFLVMTNFQLVPWSYALASCERWYCINHRNEKDQFVKGDMISGKNMSSKMIQFNSLLPSGTIWQHRFGSTLVQDDTKPLPEPMLTYHK